MDKGANKGHWGQRVHKFDVAQASKELKHCLSWPQDFTALTPSVKRP